MPKPNRVLKINDVLWTVRIPNLFIDIYIKVTYYKINIKMELKYEVQTLKKQHSIDKIYRNAYIILRNSVILQVTTVQKNNIFFVVIFKKIFIMRL